ncbi:MAG TPA: hypothetical protein DGH68_03235 [Bacteroidetes bacterium]|nr:hypothetical protein [Bacteroidota bacterium]
MFLLIAGLRAFHRGGAKRCRLIFFGGGIRAWNARHLAEGWKIDCMTSGLTTASMYEELLCSDLKSTFN